MSGLTNLPFDIVILLLRLAFVFLLYFFVFQVVRTLTRCRTNVSRAEAMRWPRVCSSSSGSKPT